MTATLQPTVATRPTVPPTIGIDPGERWIGLAVRIDGRCLDATMLDRGPTTRERGRYLGQQETTLAGRLLDTIALLMDRHHDQALEASRRWRADWPAGMPWRVAIEGIVVTCYGSVPVRLAKLQSLVPVGIPFGAVIAVYPGTVVVRPSKLGDRNAGRHGDVLAKLGPYPKELTGFRPRWFLKADGTDRIHERSAWAVAGAAQLARPLTLAEGVRA